MSNDVIEQVAMVSGRIVHRGTGRPIEGSVRVEAAEGPVIFKLLEDGTFALSADPHSFQKQIDVDGSVSLSLTIRARSAEFTTGSVTEAVAVTAPVAAFPAKQDVWKLPMTGAAANLARTIRGSVIEAKDPGKPVENATIEIVHAGTTAIATANTGADGRFSFDNVIVEAPAEIRATKLHFKTQTRQLWIDFTLGMHEEHFRMVEEP